MIDPVDLRFFGSLQRVLSTKEAVDKACKDAVDHALASGAPDALRAAREQIHGLPTDLRDTIMAEVHADMARDIAAIWDFLSGATKPRQPN